MAFTSRRAAILILLAGALPARAAPAAARAVDEGYSRQTAYVTGDSALDRLQEFFAPTLEANRKEFPGSLQMVKGFGAGDRYPQIWLRDSATLVPLSRYLYSLEHLTSWVEEHLAFQEEDGGLHDWIAFGEASRFSQWAPKAREIFRRPPVILSADKNTTEADQETSAVEAAYQVFSATGDAEWLRKKIRGRTLLDRCALGVRCLLARRFDAKRGLVTSALTVDWGDVSPTYPDQRAIYMDDATPLVVGLYSNALALRACQRLAEMCSVVRDETQAAEWRRRARDLKASLNTQLWQEARGFYRMHVVVTLRPTPDVDDSDLFALGGNTLAVLSGAASDAQARRVFECAEQRRRRYGVSTIAGVLLPPYPQGFFKNPAVATPWSYQNGGQWDWFAGRFLLAEFGRGHSARARAQLLEIARRVVTSGGLYEWATREGAGRGSPRYAGSAAALADAVFHGLFGVELKGRSLALRVRLQDQPGAIHLYQPATDAFVAYRYGYDAEGRRMTLAYAASAPLTGRIALLLPKGTRGAALALDGRLVPFAVESVGEEDFASFETDWKPHRLELRLEDALTVVSPRR